MVVAIELLAACQALDFRRPLRTTEPLERVYALVRYVSLPVVDRTGLSECLIERRWYVGQIGGTDAGG